MGSIFCQSGSVKTFPSICGGISVKVADVVGRGARFKSAWALTNIGKPINKINTPILII
jgi:hypothetical protein